MLIIGPDTLVVTDTTFIQTSIKVSDSNGLTDIESVYFIVYKPDGTTNNFKTTMFDDGNVDDNGDETAGDGIYSRIIKLDQTNAKGTYRFEFKAKDVEDFLATQLIICSYSMKIKYLIFFCLIIFLCKVIFPQLRPETYVLKGEKKYLSKNNSSNPVSNSIGDIITIGDTVWLATTRGVSVSFDRGKSWTNFYGVQPFGDDGISAIGYNNGIIWAATVTTKEVSGCR